MGVRDQSCELKGPSIGRIVGISDEEDVWADIGNAGLVLHKPGV